VSPRLGTSDGVARAAPALWTKADIDYVLAWLGCAREHGLTISYLGGWNERFDPARDPAGVIWVERLRAALDAHGYSKVELVAADGMGPGRWHVGSVMASNAAFRAAVAVIGVHDNCGLPSSDQAPFGYTCTRSATAMRLRKPLWASEVGRMDANLNAATMIRELLNGYNQSGLTGALEWPLLTAMVDGIPMENRGLITAKWPWSGQYSVNRIAWVIAQLTQFVPQGWRHVNGANRALGSTGSFNTFESPHRRRWSLVAQNTGAGPGQRVAQQTLRVSLKGRLARGPVHVWATDVWSADPSRWFVHWRDIDPSRGRFTYRVPPGYVVSFTTRSAQVRRGSADTSYAPGSFTPGAMPRHYVATADPANMAKDLSPMDGSFLYRPCAGGRSGSCLEQTVGQPPVYWHTPSPSRRPYAVVGDHTWRDYTVGADVLFTTRGSTAGLVGRVEKGFTGIPTTGQFDGYEFTCDDDGSWALYRNSARSGRTLLRSGAASAPGTGTWHRLTMRLNGPAITPAIDGRAVGTFKDSTWSGGPAGVESNWKRVQFDHLTVS
jgi:hypothetical protein